MQKNGFLILFNSVKFTVKISFEHQSGISGYRVVSSYAFSLMLIH